MSLGRKSADLASHRWIVCGSDRLGWQSLPSRMLLRGMRPALERPEQEIDWQLVFICPSRIGRTAMRAFSDELQCPIIDFDVGVHDDPYYTKLLLLQKFFENSTNANDLVLYLDYDHICRGDIDIPPIENHQVFVSSETHALGRYIDETMIDNADRCKLNHTHYNTSLILGMASTLRQAIQGWEVAYLSNLRKISARYREEIAFALSAANSGLQLRPVSTDFQGNWEFPNPSCKLFHYGGDRSQAREIKGYIRSVANGQRSDRPPLGDLFSDEIIRMVKTITNAPL